MSNIYSNKGIALFISLALMFLLSIGAVIVLLTAYNYANVSEDQVKRLRAISLAEAGINYAYYQLSPRGPDPQFIVNHRPRDVGDPPLPDPPDRNKIPKPDPDGPDVYIIVTPDTPGPGTYEIQSTVTY